MGQIQEDAGPQDDPFVPGTVLLVDVWSTDSHKCHGKHASGKNAEIVLIPPPSDDPNDPLNWNVSRKSFHLVLICAYTFLLNGLINFYSVAYVGLARDLNTDFNGLNTGSSMLFLFSGVGAVLWQPIAMKIGRRPVYILGLLIAMVGSILGALQSDWGIWVTFNVIWGIGCGPKEGLPQISLQDTYFAHQIGSKIGYWALSYAAGAFLTPLVAGYVYVRLSWRWCFWITAIGFGSLSVVLFFALDETLWPRSFTPTGALAQPAPSRSVQKVTSIDEGQDKKEVPAGNESEGSYSLVEGLAEVRMKTYWQSHPIHSWGINPTQKWLDLFLRPYLLASFPPVLWAGVFTGVSVCWWAAMFTTQSEFFTTKYHWNGAQVGLTNAGPLIGSVLGTLFAGNISDKYIIMAARRNNGIREPEQRLILLFATGMIAASGLLMYGIGVDRALHWTCPVIGMGLLGFGFTGSSIIGETYVLDSYRAVAPESLVLINIFRNVIGMSYVLAMQPWLNHSGYGNAFIQMMAMCITIHLSVIPIIIWGKKLRAMTASKYLQMLDKAEIPRIFA